MKIAFFSDTKRIKKVVIGLILFITFFPVLKGYLINLGYNFIILTSINDALEGSNIDNRFSIFILGHTTCIKTIDDYVLPGEVVPMTAEGYISNLSSTQAGHLKEFCEHLPEGSKVHSKIANQGALLDIPPLIKREPIIKEYVIKKFPDASVFIHMVIYDDYHSIYFVRYYIPF